MPKNCARLLCLGSLCIFFWANFQRVPGQDKLLGNRLGFNSRDHMDECQNQLSVTCSASLGEFGKGKAGGWKEAVNCKIK